MSDRDSWNDPQTTDFIPPPKKGMSGCMLATLIVGGLGLAMTLVCCGVGTWIGLMFIPTQTKIAEEVAAAGHRILNIEIFENFTPESAFTIDNMILSMRMAQYKQKEGKGTLVIGSLNLKIGDPNMESEQSRQFRSKFEDDINKEIDVKKKETHKITVNGQPVTVSIGEGTDQTNGKAMHIVTANFDEPDGMKFFLLRMDDDIWDQDAVIKMLENAKAP